VGFHDFNAVPSIVILSAAKDHWPGAAAAVQDRAAPTVAPGSFAALRMTMEGTAQYRPRPFIWQVDYKGVASRSPHELPQKARRLNQRALAGLKASFVGAVLNLHAHGALVAGVGECREEGAPAYVAQAG